MSFLSRSLILTVLLIVFSSPSIAYGYYTNMPAEVVIGQADFASNSANQGGSVGANTLNAPRGIFYDGQKLYVSDYTNSRVLIYNSLPTTNNKSADVVVGQPDFTSNSANQGGSPGANTLNGPIDVMVAENKLIVSDFGNKRVLIWNSIPTENNVSADVVVGQPDFTTVTAGVTASKSSSTNSLAYDTETGKFATSGYTNSRVLIYNSIPTENNVSADVVVGQPDFTSSSAYQGGGAAANSLAFPLGISFFQGKLIVSEFLHRVLIWNSIPTENNVSADVVVGQPDFTSNSANQGGSPGANTVNIPNVTVLNSGKLAIGEGGNNRVLIFNEIPRGNNASADIVLGQSDFSGGSSNQGGSASSQSLNYPASIFEDGVRMIVSDSSNNRVLIYKNTVSTPQLSINPNPEKYLDGLKLNGNVLLGERGKYAIQWVKVGVNGGGLDFADVDGGNADGDVSTRYEFDYQFSPWVNTEGINEDNWQTDTGYTLKVEASSLNADKTSLFFFSPFKFLSFSQDLLHTFRFSVPQKHIRQIKDNLDHFEIWYKDGDQDWQTYVSNVPTGDIDEDTGVLTFVVPNSLTSDEYVFKIVAVSKDSGWKHYSNALSEETLQSRESIVSNSMSPLQLNNLSGNIISSFNQSAIKSAYTLDTSRPVYRGIAYADSKVVMNVKDKLTGQIRNYKVTVDKDSSFTISPVVFPSSIISIYLLDTENKYTYLPEFELKVVN